MKIEKSRTVNAWQHWQHPVSGALVPVFVQRISRRGTAYIVKPNPWALRVGDARAAWTQRQAVRETDLVDEPKVPECVQAAFITAIGEPQMAIERADEVEHKAQSTEHK